MCPINDEENCYTCDFGYSLIELNSDENAGISDMTSSKTCKQNECNCDNGSSGVGEECPENGADWCLECMPGFLLDITSTSAKCVSCPVGEYFDEGSQLCRIKECTRVTICKVELSVTT